MNLRGVEGGKEGKQVFEEKQIKGPVQSNEKQHGGLMNFPGATVKPEGDARKVGEVSPRKWIP